MDAPVTLRPLFDPADFRIPAGVAHVCAGGEPPFLLRHDAALRQYAIDKSSGMPGRTAMEAQVERARAGIARMWGADAGEIGFVSSVADGISMVAESIAWRPGDNVVVDTHEYPSVVAPFALQRRPPIGVRVARGNAPDRLVSLVDARTRVIGVSHVSYLTGERFDLDALRRLADSVGALLVVDFTQVAGWLPFQASVADFGFSACYKWLLGMTGVAAAYWNRQRQPDWSPTTAGWHSILPAARPDYTAPLGVLPDALRFTRGNPAHGPVYVLAEALDYLAQYDREALRRHVSALTADLLARLAAVGIPSTTPMDPDRHGANVCLDSSRAQDITDALYERGIYAWNGHGRVRFSFHGYNAAGDVDRIMDALRDLWRP
ncbi:aminotransferase class V-fold PLP-dependent enzyme [Limobrevibacterium gyesilva]|uniref:Aminotransferase class V-fold PLP-dependent enzyme n=1 Tax=Limobrevibacterium gyesilva TaxID=2991712 RepID=A0AA41YV89_9PROT|nr:aminotransferase class V-fold PLP-dependent enzyme [Limobrevibacterium gyesilva]MCW3477085.1 aminotransferase class V-fold PLP-dependent enzyme [Limobrevibacterium gyesilva]